VLKAHPAVKSIVRAIILVMVSVSLPLLGLALAYASQLILHANSGRIESAYDTVDSLTGTQTTHRDSTQGSPGARWQHRTLYRNEIHRWTLTTTARTLLVVRSSSMEFTPVLRIYSAEENAREHLLHIETLSAPGEWNIIVPNAGTYRIEVANGQGETGEYEIRLG
jgi:hypothetical protein